MTMTILRKAIPRSFFSFVAFYLTTAVMAFQAPHQGEIDRIYRGWHLQPHEFPWMVKLKTTFPSNTQSGQFKKRVCGGALISDQWVLTARHCITWHPPDLPGSKVFEVGQGIPAIFMKVYLGSHGLYGEDGLPIIAERAIGRDDYGQPQCSFKKRSNGQFRGRGGCEQTPERRGLHQTPIGPFEEVGGGPLSFWEFLFGPSSKHQRRRQVIQRRQGGLRHQRPPQQQGQDVTFTNDIALVKLSRRVRFSDKIQPVRLPKNDFSYMGYQAYVSGWGIQAPDQGPSATLKGAELAVVDGAKTRGCSSQQGWGKMCAVSLDDYNGIAGSACPGDSGSPLVTFDVNNGGWTIIGLLSNGAKSCFRGLPEVYTKVGDYLSWIDETIRINSVP